MEMTSAKPKIRHVFGFTSELYIFDIWNDNLQSFNRETMKHRYQSFTRIGRQFQSPRTSILRGLDVGFIPLLPKELPYMANNDEYNDEYLCRDFFVGFNFWSRLSFQISEFRVHWASLDRFRSRTSTLRRRENGVDPRN